MIKDIKLKTPKESDLKNLWEIAYGPKADLEWMKLNGPYFKDPVETWETFITGYGKSIVDSSMTKLITVEGVPIGIVSAYFEDANLKQWLEVGIVLYDSQFWNKGIGTVALSMWINEQFNQFSYLPHIGFTTWSGNKSMQTLGEKCGMQKEGVIRKVRYWEGHYYDSIKYGILRDEWTHS